MGDAFIPIMICGILFIGLPWIVLHYVTQWKKTGALTGEDEKLLDELHYTARQLEDRLGTIERIIAADHPDWKLGSARASETLDYNTNRRN
ncbi:MAG: envelope stress response membrane protein PspB [Sphingomonas sp.]|jgi:phage shock protein B